MGKERNLRESSLNAYIRSLQKLHEKIHDEKDFKNLDWLDDYEKVMDAVEKNVIKYKDGKQNEKTSSVSSQKTTLAAIIVALSTERDYDDDLIKAYQEDMVELQKDYNEGEAKYK